MDIGKLVKWIVIAIVLFAVWKYVVPWVKKEAGSKSSISTAAITGDSSCTPAAMRASDAWGSGLGRFVNPPYDLDAWSAFKGDVDAKISEAESGCGCESESCRSVRSVMSDLRGLVSEYDSAIRSGTAPPEDAVQRQERIDDLLTQAQAMARAGK